MAFSKEKSKRLFPIFLFVSGVVLGFFIGGFFWANTQPRSYLMLNKCEHCWNPKELAGLLVSLGIARTPHFIPHIIKETDKSIAIEHPFPQARIHYVILPKVDVKDISDITEADSPYVLDSLRLIGDIVREQNLQDYQVITNGPARQSVRYLHFHLLAK